MSVCACVRVCACPRAWFPSKTTHDGAQFLSSAEIEFWEKKIFLRNFRSLVVVLSPKFGLIDRWFDRCSVVEFWGKKIFLCNFGLCFDRCFDRCSVVEFWGKNFFFKVTGAKKILLIDDIRIDKGFGHLIDAMKQGGTCLQCSQQSSGFRRESNSTHPTLLKS